MKTDHYCNVISCVSYLISKVLVNNSSEICESSMLRKFRGAKASSRTVSGKLSVNRVSA